jgi:hypothetical protein
VPVRFIIDSARLMGERDSARAFGRRRFIAGAAVIATAEQKVADQQANRESNRELSMSLDFESYSTREPRMKRNEQGEKPK